MVHVKLNEREANPNPHINFITSLPIGNAPAEEDARHLLRALAAQVRPVMKAHGLAVNSFEEYEYNKVFAGRNWNNGEVIEIVLRGAHGMFQPIHWLLSTLCHELAHIKHMNHGPAFQALWAQLRREVRELQTKGYYGDGYWSSGTRLADSARVGGQGVNEIELPEYMCGGAHSRARPPNLRRRRHRHNTQSGPSLHTGRQTERKRKAGSRVTSTRKFEGGGRALNEDADGEAAKKTGIGFRKQAGSKRAREERALAVERRLAASGASSVVAPPAGPNNSGTGSGSEEDSGPFVPETDQDRRRVLFDSMCSSDADCLKASERDYADGFVLPPTTTSCHTMSVTKHGATAVDPSSFNHKGKGRASRNTPPGSGSATASGQSNLEGPSMIETPNIPAAKRLSDFFASMGAPTEDSTPPQKRRKTAIHGNEARAEAKQRREEAPLGMPAGSGRVAVAEKPRNEGRTAKQHAKSDSPELNPRSKLQDLSRDWTNASWSCLICTLLNEPTFLACSACGTPRGESTWARHPSRQTSHN